jgi:hypothetical protein
VHVDLPLQLVASHQGGQIDTVDNEVITQLHTMAGGLNTGGNGCGYHQKLGCKTICSKLQYKCQRSRVYNDDGIGFFVNPYLKTKIGLTVMGSYWYGDQFTTAQGSPLYASANDQYPMRVDKTREFVMLRLLYDLKVADGLTLTARAEPFYDTYEDSIEYSFGLLPQFLRTFLSPECKKEPVKSSNAPSAWHFWQCSSFW